MNKHIKHLWVASVLVALSLSGCGGGKATAADKAPTSAANAAGVDRPGSDYRDFDLDRSDPLLCRDACVAEAPCRAWTYVKPGVQGEKARCWLKEGVPEAVKSDCCVSGVRT